MKRLRSGSFRRPLARRAAALVGLCALLLLATLAAYGVDRAASRGEPLGGVQLGPVAVSGLAGAELERAIASAAKRLATRRVAVTVAGQVFFIKPAEIDLTVDHKATRETLLRAGRSGSFAGQIAYWMRSWTTSHAVSLSVRCDRSALRKKLEAFGAAAIDDPPFPGEVAYRGGKLQAAAPRPGHVLDVDATADAVLSAAARGAGTGVEAVLNSVEPPVDAGAEQAALAQAKTLLTGPITLSNDQEELEVTFAPDELLKAVRTRATKARQLEIYFEQEVISKKLKALDRGLEEPPYNARFVVERSKVTIEPSRPGTLVDPNKVARELLGAAKTSERRGHLPIQRSVPPNFTTQDAEALNITGLVSSFTTFHKCCQPRVKNIHRIADLLNNVIVKPGERFSVNELIGPRDKAKGFVLAPSIALGEMVKTYGGGISQFATTMFNAIFDGGYEIIQRQPHSYYFSRYPVAHEATLSYPSPDLIFRNDTKSGVLIRTEYGPTFIRVKLFGNNGGRKVRRTVSRKFNIVKPDIEYIADDDLDPDEEKVKYAGQVGWTVVARRVITEADGTKREQKRNVVYQPRTRIVRVHSCNIPEGQDGHTGDKCPEPEPEEDAEDDGAEDEDVDEAVPVD